MPCFKHLRNGSIIEVGEQHAQQVIRKKSVYEEVECPAKNVTTENTGSATASVSTNQSQAAKKPSKPTTQKSTRSKANSKKSS